MWRACGRELRVREALKYRGIDHEKINLRNLENIMVKRGITDRKLCDLYDKMLSYLEPKSCRMCHCESHGVAGFCNCCESLVPSKCKKNREFMKRCKKRANEAAGRFLEIIGDREPLINYEMEYYQFFNGIEKQKDLVMEFAFVGKWSSRLQSDVWDEIKRRKKKGRG